jgi:hypothetical protein
MVLQLLLGGVSGIYVIFRLFKDKILGLVGIRLKMRDHANTAQTISQKEEQPRRSA